jgi:hypothetical protein
MDEESHRLKPELSDIEVSTASGTMEKEIESKDTDRDEEEEEPSKKVSRLRTEIDATRDDLGTYVSELDRRRHEALDFKLQVKKHPVVVIGVGVVIIAAVAGAVALTVHARRDTLGRRVKRALARIAPSPPPPPADPDWLLKLLLKTALPIGVGLAMRFLKRERPPQSA